MRYTIINKTHIDEDIIMEHEEFCNCEDCWWSRDCQEVCATCGCLVGAGCPCSNDEVNDENN